MTFSDLKVGDIFKCKDGLLYKKTSDDVAPVCSYKNNSKCITKGIECYIACLTEVRPIISKGRMIANE